MLDIDAGRHTQVQAEVPSGARQWNVVVVGVGVRDTLLGPEGSDDTHVLVTVALGGYWLRVGVCRLVSSGRGPHRCSSVCSGGCGVPVVC